MSLINLTLAVINLIAWNVLIEKLLRTYIMVGGPRRLFFPGRSHSKTAECPTPQ